MLLWPCRGWANFTSVPGMSEITDFYTRPSPTSRLGRHEELVRGLPTDPEALSAIVRGLLIHNFVVQTQGPQMPPERMAQMQTVGAEAILDNVLALDPGPLDRERPAERRMVGFCYHFALLHCALLRATGTPARIRCGFAGYFVDQWWVDHWVTEYWDGDGWKRTDAQIGRGDLTGDDFQDGPTGWSQCRDGASVPARYGNGEFWGWDELRGTLINDVAALNKVEVAGWYWCDQIKVEPLDQSHDELDSSLDALAHRATAATSSDTASVDAIRECFDQHPELHPPADAVAR
jgi:hypothetical protein